MSDLFHWIRLSIFRATSQAEMASICQLIGGHWEAALGELRGRQGRFGEIDGLGVSMNQLQWW